MSGAHNRPDVLAAGCGADLRVAIVRSRWNAEVVDRLAVGARAALAHCGVTQVETVEVAGALEIPFAASILAATGRLDALVVVGAVVRGETTHYELVTQGCATGVQRVQFETSIPIGFGVLAVENEAQALERSLPDGGANAGSDAAYAAIELALLARSVS